MDASFAQEPTRLIDAMLIRPRLAGLCILVGVLLLIIPSFSGGVCAAGLQSEAEPHALKEAQAAFDKKEYQQALERLERADKGGALNADALRLKVRAQLRLGKPREALLDYEALERKMTGEDLVLLKEVVLGFVVVLTKDMREQMRGAAYTALKDLESAAAVPFLEDGLSDGSALVRALVVEGLGKTEAGRRSPKLRKALDDQAGLVKAAALKVLGRTGDASAVPLLEKYLKDEQPIVRLAAAGALYHTGRKAMWDQVRGATSAANPEERASALRLLGDLKDDRSLGVLVEAIKDPQPSVRGAAASALGSLGKGEGIAAVEQVLTDKIPAVRTSAAVSLGELGDKRSVGPLKQALSDPNPIVQAAALSALLRIGEPVQNLMGAVNGLLQQQDPGPRSATAKALGRAEGVSRDVAIDVLSNMLNDPIPRPRIAAVRSLGQIGGDSVIPILKHTLHDEDDAVRAAAGGALGRVLNNVGKPIKPPKI
jgi:HEAT repeat protein